MIATQTTRIRGLPDKKRGGGMACVARAPRLCRSKALEEAMRRGVDLRGYTYWSLIDNFEWQV